MCFGIIQKFQHGIGASPGSLKLSKKLKEGVVAAFDQQCEESAKTKYLQNRVFVLCLKSAVQRSIFEDRVCLLSSETVYLKSQSSLEHSSVCYPWQEPT